jgi:hypothetical protein
MPTEGTAMAGHSKWANIQHRKGKQDKLRSKMFSKLAKEITVAAKMGTPTPTRTRACVWRQGRQGAVDAQGRDRPRDQEIAGRRCRGLYRDPL